MPRGLTAVVAAWMLASISGCNLEYAPPDVTPEGLKAPGGPDGPSVDSEPVCIALTCDGAGAECGALSDGCGGTLECGTCSAGLTCGAAQPNQCDICAPATCDATENACGVIDDGCGGQIDCGTCNQDSWHPAAVTDAEWGILFQHTGHSSGLAVEGDQIAWTVSSYDRATYRMSSAINFLELDGTTRASVDDDNLLRVVVSGAGAFLFSPWRAAETGLRLADSAGERSALPVPLVAEEASVTDRDAALYVNGNDAPHLHVVNLENGSAWTEKWVGSVRGWRSLEPAAFLDSVAVVADSVIVAGAAFGPFTYRDQRFEVTDLQPPSRTWLMALDAATGDVRWRAPTGNATIVGLWENPSGFEALACATGYGSVTWGEATLLGPLDAPTSCRLVLITGDADGKPRSARALGVVGTVSLVAAPTDAGIWLGVTDRSGVYTVRNRDQGCERGRLQFWTRDGTLRSETALLDVSCEEHASDVEISQVIAMEDGGALVGGTVETGLHTYDERTQRVKTPFLLKVKAPAWEP